MIKKILSWLLCAALGFGGALGLVGCGERNEDKTALRLGVTVYDSYDTFVGEMMTTLTAYARSLEQQHNVTINILRASADGKQTLQNDQVESFIESGCDIICVNLVERSDASMIIDRAEGAGVPIIFFNRELVADDLQRSELLYYVGAEARESGEQQAEIVIDNWNRKKETLDKNGDGVMQYVMLEGQAGHQDAIVRTESSIASVTAAGIRTERLEDEIANWVRSQAETKMMGWLETHGDAIEVVFANNDDMALGAIDALKRQEIPMREWPLVVGIDGTEPGLNAVLSGEMAGTSYNDGAGQAGAMADLACALHFGWPMPEMQGGKYIRLPYQIVTAENVVNYIR